MTTIIELRVLKTPTQVPATSMELGDWAVIVDAPNPGFTDTLIMRCRDNVWVFLGKGAPYTSEEANLIDVRIIRKLTIDICSFKD